MQSKSLERRLLSLVFGLSVFAPETRAQSSPFDSTALIRTAAAACYRSPLYTVVERERPGAVGSDHFIGAASRSCQPDSLPGDLVLRNEWAEYFAGLRGHFLVLDSGTGPDARGVIVLDLRTRRRTYSGLYADFEPSVRGDTLALWQPYDLPAPHPGCPHVSGLGDGIDSLIWLDLRTGRTRFAGRVRCATRQ